MNPIDRLILIGKVLLVIFAAIVILWHLGLNFPVC